MESEDGTITHSTCIHLSCPRLAPTCLMLVSTLSLTWVTCHAAHHRVSRCPPDAGHVAEHADGPGDAAAGVEHQVLAVVSPQQLHVLRHADGADLQSVMGVIVITVCHDHEKLGVS